MRAVCLIDLFLEKVYTLKTNLLSVFFGKKIVLVSVYSRISSLEGNQEFRG